MEVSSRPYMRSRAMGLALLLVISTLGMLLIQHPVQSELEDEPVMEQAAPVTWTMSDGPLSTGGWSTGMWQPGTNGAMWNLDFSPNGQLLAAVDLNDHRLHVWNISDGRTLLWIGHTNALVDVIFLSDTWVLAADIEENWFAYQVIDQGARPASSTLMRSGSWTGGMSGQYDGNLWGMDISDDRSRVVFCGFIDDPNIGGEVVVADTTHFTAGSSANSGSLFVTSWPTDCSFSPNGSVIAATGRHYDSTQGFNRDVVYGINAGNMSLYWTRNVAGSEANAWAIDWEPNGNAYTVGWTRPSASEGVISNFNHIDGGVFWYNTLLQDVSDLEWMPGGGYIGVGLHDPGRMMLIDSSGLIQTDVGWHSTVVGTNGTHADILAIAADSQDTRLATSGRDGAIEVWTVDSQKFELRIANRFGTSLTREIAMQPMSDLFASADSSGVSTLRDSRSGAIINQCFHPSFGQNTPVIPFTKSVSWGQTFWAVGFSDGMVVGCDLMSGKPIWQYDITQHHTFGVFGRVSIHPGGQYAAISWGENSSDTTSDGRVAIIDFLAGSVIKEWSYSDVHWAVSFNNLGTRLASADQTGGVRLWNTSDVDPVNWLDAGIVYSHGNYTGVVEWANGIDMLVTAGWDRAVKIYDVQSAQVVNQGTLLGEAFGALLLIQNGMLVVATGNAGNSATGQVEIFNITQSAARDTSYATVNLPRGLDQRSVDGHLVVVNNTGSVVVIRPDRDGDGWPDGSDEFPDDPTQHADFDSDGWGDNTTSPTGDSCPQDWGNSSQDRFGCLDSDGDGYSNPDTNWLAHPTGAADAFVSDSAQWHDTDGDGHGDNYTYAISEGSGLRTAESGDALPNDATQWRDNDGDGCGDNYSYNLDAGNRINENGDAFSTDSTQCNDFDGDGYGDNYTYTISQGSGLRVENGDAFSLDNLAWSDLDGDGCPTASATGLRIDFYPGDPDYCDEIASFVLPVGLELNALGEQSNWRIWVNWTTTSLATDNIELYGQSVTDSEGVESVTGNTLDATSPLQFWSSSVDLEGPLAETWTIPRGTNPQETSLTLRLTVKSDQGESLEQWLNVTHTVPPPDEVENPNPDPGSDPNSNPEQNPNQNGEGTSNTTGGNEGEAAGGDGPPLGMLGIIVGVLLLIGGVVVFMMRSKTKSGMSAGVQIVDQTPFAPPQIPADPVVHPPCKDCGGFLQEMTHDGNRWTWCPSCRAWQDYLGKA